MRLEGIHHITAITADAPRNVDFYGRVLGLRLVKKTVNQDDPTVYHLFYADEKGSPGSDITFFEYPDAHRGRAGAGMVHRVVWRVAGADALDFWEKRLNSEGFATTRDDGLLRFEDPEGLAIQLWTVEKNETALTAHHPDIPRELALQGFEGVFAFASDANASSRFLEDALGFTAVDRVQGIWEARGVERSSFIWYEDAPDEPGIPGAGTVHHVAWSSKLDEHEAWRDRAMAGGATPTPVIDRFYFKSIYFREPSGVLFEIATIGPGFTADEPLESLGERISLPPKFEQLREQVEKTLTPLPNPRAKTPVS